MRSPEEAEAPTGPLRRGWTTGACATAAAKAGYAALLTGEFPDPVEIALPGGQRTAFALAKERLSDASALAGVIKDAGDDPDVTHGALVFATVRRGAAGTGVTFRAGPGVGTVTKPGLPLPVGEPAINPVPREMIRAAIAEVAAALGGSGDVLVEIGVENGEALAAQTWNPRLGILGGLSILGTTGIVVPYSCAAWIHSIHRGIDVARATGERHVAGSVGNASERAVARYHGLPEGALLDMGDFVGGMLKYLRGHPVPRLTIAGGFAKMTKLARGHLDLHSGRSQVDLAGLAGLAASLGASAEICARIAAGNTALEALRLTQEAGLDLAGAVAAQARVVALDALDGAPVAVDVLVVDRQGAPIGHAD